MPFDVERQMTIEVRTGTFGFADLATTGLAAVGRPELTMLGVPGDLVADAGFVLNTVADYVANQRPIGDGERIGTGHPAGALIVRLVRHGDGVQRVVDGFDAREGTPYIALATVLCWRAAQSADQGDRPAADAALARSLELPIPPEVDGPPLGHPYNWGGALGAAQRAGLDEAQRDRWQGEAARRSVTVQRAMFGDPLADLGGADRAALAELVPALVAVGRAQADPVRSGPVVVFTG
ncbi:MAG: hypothetical protein ABMB14_31395, partial [Myxococcota bacterium]